MAKWYQHANEVAFKPVPDGYVFQAPSPWLFAPSRYYLVNEEQKAALMLVLNRLRTLRLAMAVVAFPLMTAAMIYLQIKAHQPPLMSASVGSALALVLIVLVPHIYLQNGLGPLVATLPRANQRFTWRDQFERMATALPRALLIAGAVGGILMILGGILSVVDSIVDHHGIAHLMGSAPSMLMGSLVAAYFFWLIRLKRKLTTTHAR